MSKAKAKPVELTPVQAFLPGLAWPPPPPPEPNAPLANTALRISQQVHQVYDKVSQVAVDAGGIDLVFLVLPGLPAGTTIERTLSIRPVGAPLSPLLLCDKVYVLNIPSSLDKPVLGLELQSELYYDEADRGLGYDTSHRLDDSVKKLLGVSRLNAFTVFIFLTDKVSRIFIQSKLEGTACQLLSECGCFCFCEVDAQGFLAEVASAQRSPNLLYWVPLMKGAGHQDVIKEWMRLARLHFASNDLANLILVALVFSELAKCDVVWKAHAQEINHMESKLFKEWTEEAVKQGEQRGEVKGLVNFLIETLTLKFPKEVESLRPTLESQQDLNQIKEWLRQAINISSFSELRSLIQPQAAP